MTTIEILARRFPQIYLRPAEGVSQSPLYRAIVRKGQSYEGELSHFITSPEDTLTMEPTPVGEVMVVFLKHRADFECFYRVMACRCEPVPVPPTMGASYVSGFNDWGKIHAHLEEYKADGGEDPDGEFQRFTATPSNYKGTMVILSDGPYSALPASRTPYSEEEWLRVSLRIRKYHELTHFVCRKLYPDKKYPVWDELLADCMGLLFATGEYDLALAQAFLGIENGSYTGGRLENYLDAPPDGKIVAQVTGVMETLARRCRGERDKGNEGYALMQILESEAEEICGEFPG